MPIAPLMKKSSYLMQDFQKEIIIQLLHYFQNHIQNGNGSYLATLDFDKINFYWCKDLFYENNGEIMGAWTPMYKDSIFIKPTLYNQILRNNFKQTQLFKKYNLQQVENQTTFYPSNNFDRDNEPTDKEMIYISLWNEYCANRKSYNIDKVRIGLNCSKLFVKDFDKYMFINSLFTYNESSTINTILHQLYHKYQFSASWITPVLYIFNFLVSQFLGYENASKLKWTVQGDVRVVVDNDETHKKIAFFEQASYRLPQFYRFKHSYDQFEQENCKNIIQNEFKTYFKTYQFKTMLKIYKKNNALQDDFIKEIEDFCK